MNVNTHTQPSNWPWKFTSPHGQPTPLCPVPVLLHILVIWVEQKLQDISTKQRSFIRSSEELKNIITKLCLPPSTRLFTADAVSVYTSIDTHIPLHTITIYLYQHSKKFKDIPVEALSIALGIITENLSSWRHEMTPINRYSYGHTSSPSHMHTILCNIWTSYHTYILSIPALL